MTKCTLFISDIHLTEYRPEITALFTAFLTSIVINVDAIYILGDFFDAWCGDDDNSFFNKIIFDLLLNAKTKIYIMPGNRDFILGEVFAKKTNTNLLVDPSIIDLYGMPTMLSHGNMFCTKDKGQILFARFTNNKICRKIFLMLPLIVRKKMATIVRFVNLKNKPKKSKSPEIFSTDQNEIIRQMEKHHVLQLIHGHTHHEAGVYKFSLHDQPATRIVLGDWLQHVGNYLIYRDDHTFELKKFS